jgi:ubiquitin-like modifier-activating enzyme 5
MAITAGLLVQNALKRLLGFGSVSNFVGYDALNDFFPRYSLRPNPECDNAHCRKWSELRKSEAGEKVIEEVEELAEVVHEDGDEWGIEIEEEEEEEETAKMVEPVSTKGVRRQYEEGEKTKKTVDDKDLVQLNEDESLDDLASQLRNL